MGAFFSPRCCTVCEKGGQIVFLPSSPDGKQSFVLTERIGALLDPHLAASLMEKNSGSTSRERRALLLSATLSPDRMKLHAQAVREFICIACRAVNHPTIIKLPWPFHNFCG